MAKKINDIIQASVNYVLTEQKKGAKLNPVSPTNPKNVTDKTDNIGEPWPANLPRKKYIPQLESFFQTIGANPFMIGQDPTGSKNTYPVMVWNYAKVRFRFYNDHTVIVLNADASLDKFYWRYIHKPVNAKYDPRTQIYSIQEMVRNSNSDIINEQGMQYLPPDVVLGIESAQLSQNGTGKIVVSKISGGEAEFTIYISVSGQPTIIYQKDQAAIAKQANWNKKKEDIRGAMDIIGWVPFAGDVLDVVQASWYTYDYVKYGDWTNLVYASLSLIAAIPYVGSGVKAVVKPIARRISRTPIGLADELAVAIRNQVRVGRLGRDALKKVKYTFQFVFRNYINYSTTLKRKLKLNPDQLKRWEQVEEQMAILYRNIGEQLDELIKAEKHGIDLATGNINPSMADKLSSLIIKSSVPNKKNIPKEVIDDVVESVGLMKKAGGTIAKIGKFLSKLSVTKAQARTVYKNLTMSFEKQILRSLQEGGSEFIARLIANSTPAQQQQLLQLILRHIPEAAQQGGNLINPRRFVQLDFIRATKSGQVNLKYWENLIHTYVSQDLDNEFAEALATYFIKENNVIWLKILNDPLKQLQNVLPTTGKEAAAIVLQNLTLGRKWLRIWFDIIHDASYDAGLTIADSDEQSLIYQTLKEKLMSENQREVTQSVVKFITKPAGWILPNMRGAGGSDIYNLPGYSRKDQWIDPATGKTKPKVSTTPKAKAKVTPEPKPTVTPKVTPKAKTTITPKAQTKTKEKEEDEVNYYDADGNIDATKLSL